MNLYSKPDLPESSMLLLEFHGSDASVQEQADRFGDIAADHGCKSSSGRQSRKTEPGSGRHDMMRRGLSPPLLALTADLLQDVFTRPRPIADMMMFEPQCRSCVVRRTDVVSDMPMDRI